MLIDCIECGNKISDKSSNCTKCGCPTTASLEALNKKCDECGNHISADDKVCSECGAPHSAEASSESVSTKDLEEYDSLRDTAIIRHRASLDPKRKYEAVALTEDNIADVVRNEVCPYCNEDFILKYDDFESTNHPCPHCSKTINIVEEWKQHKIRKEKRAFETEQEEIEEREKAFISLLIVLPTFLVTFIIILMQTTALFYYPITIGNFVTTAIAAIIVGVVVASAKEVGREAFTLTLFGLLVVYLATLYVSMATGFIGGIVEDSVADTRWRKGNREANLEAAQYYPIISHFIVGFLPHVVYAVVVGLIFGVNRILTEVKAWLRERGYIL